MNNDKLILIGKIVGISILLAFSLFQCIGLIYDLNIPRSFGGALYSWTDILGLLVSAFFMLLYLFMLLVIFLFYILLYLCAPVITVLFIIKRAPLKAYLALWIPVFVMVLINNLVPNPMTLLLNPMNTLPVKILGVFWKILLELF